MSKYSIDSNTLTAIADAIREKGGTSDPILTEGMAAAIAEIKTGGVFDGYQDVVVGSFVPSEDITSEYVIVTSKPFGEIKYISGFSYNSVIIFALYKATEKNNESKENGVTYSTIFCIAPSWSGSGGGYLTSGLGHATGSNYAYASIVNQKGESVYGDTYLMSAKIRNLNAERRLQAGKKYYYAFLIQEVPT